jgi:uncharacterized protein YbaR (Trm112 family)
MKIWLCDILACPICKSYPLKLYIFSFETEPDEFHNILNIYEKRDLESIKSENIIEFIKENGDIFIKDEIIIEKNTIDNYLKLTLQSIEELNNIIDKSGNEVSKKSLELITKEIKSRIIDFSKNPNVDEIDNILPELYFINKIKIETEIESGLFLCEGDGCNRWYPIIETIPMLLPDDARERYKDKEIDFLKTNKNKMDEEFFNKELKPYNI